MSFVRVACAVIPDFTIQVHLAGLPACKRGGPIAMIESKEPGRVVDANQEARQFGVVVGQTASQARATCPSLRCLVWQNEQIQDAQNRVKEALMSVSPHVESMERPIGGYWLDVRGMTWLGGESGLAHRAIKSTQDQGYAGLRVGIGETFTVARAAVFRTESAHPIRIIPNGSGRDFLASSELDELPLAPEILRVLSGLGLKTVAQLNELPESSLINRFGEAGQETIDLILGRDPRRIHEHQVCTPPEAVLVLEVPVSEAPMLVFGIRGLAQELSDSLARISLAINCLNLVLLLDDRSEHLETLFPVRPLCTADGIFELVRERLEKMADTQLASSVLEVRLRGVELVPPVPQQTHLGTERWSVEALELALDRLRGRFDEQIVFEAVQHDAHDHENRAHWKTILEVPLEPINSDKEVSPLSTAPVRRRFATPRTMEVKVDGSGRPVSIHWKNQWWQVSSLGPERLSGRWWTRRPNAFEDYRVILKTHEVLWIRRESHTHSWWLHGWFD